METLPNNTVRDNGLFNFTSGIFDVIGKGADIYSGFKERMAAIEISRRETVTPTVVTEPVGVNSTPNEEVLRKVLTVGLYGAALFVGYRVLKKVF